MLAALSEYKYREHIKHMGREWQFKSFEKNTIDAVFFLAFSFSFVLGLGCKCRLDTLSPRKDNETTYLSLEPAYNPYSGDSANLACR